MLKDSDVTSYRITVEEDIIDISKVDTNKWICCINYSNTNTAIGLFLLNTGILKPKNALFREYSIPLAEISEVLFENEDVAYECVMNFYKEREQSQICEPVLFAYNNNDLDNEKFVKELYQNERTPFKLDNEAVIIVCKPVLCYEKHTKELQERRLQFEYDYWKSFTDNEKHVKYKLAHVMLKHPMFKKLQ